MNGNTRYANLLIDVADALASGQTSEDAWWTANRIARQLGANALNAGAFSVAGQNIQWMRSTMDPLWLEEYADQAMFEVDSVLASAMAGRAPAHFDVQLQDRHRDGEPRSGALFSGMMTYDYRFIIAHSWFHDDTGVCLALSCKDDPQDMFGLGTARAFSVVSAMMAERITAPGAEVFEAWAYSSNWQMLNVAERDILAFMANGMTVSEVADEVLLTEFETHRLIHQARLKMKAKTTEQALALAIQRGLVTL
ncbi:helix-turn-helix transcriptional regulator [Yoonia litorea]|uniref:DNA-binding transcriptional regulator, CsgD family n=1 Tax=Yoonia litorea TaxID=1123755 RepID=A0A1I6MHH7_9RHOB|nr:hypothetical protein [Yoonia litorea]SFS15154.1 DNA-binding transcriptional regulator, CsgD family [Yoonia litorea]